MVRTYILFVFIVVSSIGIIAQDSLLNISAPYTIQKYRYWFDTDKTLYIENYASGTASIDASMLDEGFHSLHYQVVSDLGDASPAQTVSFYKLATFGREFKDYTILSVRYWFDTEKTSYTATYSSGTASIDASMLDEGFHSLHYQVVSDLGDASPARTVAFYKLPSSGKDFKDYAIKKVRYWQNKDPGKIYECSYGDGIITVDMSNVDEGFHIVCYQVISDDGQVSPVIFADAERWLYDIYVSKTEEYNDSIVSNDPLFAQKPDLKLHFMPDDTNIRGHLTVDEGTTLSLGKYVQTANWGSKNDASKYAKAGVDYYHPTTLLNEGFMRADSVIVKQSLYRDCWHFLSFPFNVNVDDINVPEDTYWALRSYDGVARAAGEMTDTWTHVKGGNQMEAGKGYILQLTRESTNKAAELTFKALNDAKKNALFTADDVAIQLEEYQSEFAHNRSWNLVGNPYPCFFDSRGVDQDGTIIVWNGNGYSAYSLSDDNYILMPFEAFFIQKPLNVDALTFHKDGRQHTNEVLPKAASRRQSKVLQNRNILNFMLSDSIATDRSRVVINEQASMGYDSDKDAPKFMEAKPMIPQLFSVESGVQYAINERPLGDGLITFSLFAPRDGEYCFSVEGDTMDMSVLDTETGKVWSFSDGDYIFTATKGMHNCRLVVSLTGETTAIDQVNAYNDGEIKVTNGQLAFCFMRDKNIKVFSLDGRVLFDNIASQAVVKVTHGVYLVDIDGKTIKIMVK